ncbi:MAG: GH25 family lysozyme [Chloroflexota bacterium]
MMTSQDTQAKGIDVSHHRGLVDWQKVRDIGISFGIVKATDGNAFVDPQFDTNWTKMRRARVFRGAYHFYRPNTDPIEQANHYLQWVGDILHETDMPPILDVEAYPQSNRDAFEAFTLQERLDRIMAWLMTVWESTGRAPMIYTNLGTWREVLGDTEIFTHFPLWIAHYNVAEPMVPAKNWSGLGWKIWQTTYDMAVPGVNDGAPPVDFNLFNGTRKELKSWLLIEGRRNLAPKARNEQVYAAVLQASLNRGKDYQKWLNRIGLNYLISPEINIPRQYDGPAIKDFPLRSAAITAIQEALKEIKESEGLPTYGDLTNQEMINIIFEAAELLDMTGIKLLTLAGLVYLVDFRNLVYTGPKIKNMDDLTRKQKVTIREILNTDSSVEEPTPEDPPAETIIYPYPGKTNQDIINAFYAAGEILELSGWTLLSKAELTQLVDYREQIYQDLPIDQISYLSLEEKNKILEALGIITNQLPIESKDVYPGLVNQDMVNLFYRAASQGGESGWVWIEQEGLTYLTDSTQIRYQPYQGPLLEEMNTLNVEQRSLLYGVLEEIRN